MRRALPDKHNKKKKNIPLLSKLNLDKGKKKKKHSQKKLSQKTDDKESTSVKRSFFGNIKKESTETASPAKDEGGALGKIRDQIKGKISQGSKKRLSTKQEDVPLTVNQEETKEANEANSPKNEEKAHKKKLKDIMKSIRPAGSKANAEPGEKEQ